MCVLRDGVYLRWVGDPKCHHVFAGVLDKEVMFVEKLHLPHAQLPELIEKLKEPPLGRGGAVVLRPPPQVHQQPVFQGVDGFLLVEARETGLTFGLRLAVSCRQSQEVILITKTSNGADVEEGSFWCDLK